MRVRQGRQAEADELVRLYRLTETMAAPNLLTEPNIAFAV